MHEYQTTSSPVTSEIFVHKMDSMPINLYKKRPQIENSKGYGPVYDKNVGESVLRDRKTFVFWTLVTLLFVLAFGNLILTMTILGVLELGQGMKSVEVISSEYAVKLFGNIDLDDLYKRDGRIEGFFEEPIQIISEHSSISLKLAARNGRANAKLKIDKNGTLFNGINYFQIKNQADEIVFSINDPAFTSLKQPKHFKTKQIETNRIRSPVNENLRISGEELHLKGAEGTKITGRELLWSADQDIYLKSINGSIVLSSKNGTYLDVNKIAIIKLKTNNFVTTQYKICVCMPQGRLFRIPVLSLTDRVYCNHLNTDPQYNPCI